MPNDCWNYITIICRNSECSEEITNFVVNELDSLKDELKDLKNAYSYEEIVTIKKKGRRGIMFRMWSAWKPDYYWLEGLLEKYPNCWIKNEWNEEGGLAGVWIGFMNDNNDKDIQRLTWNDLCIEEQHFLFMDEEEEKVNVKF
jgi:hypothetical protein